ncbi:unnamed protein product [Eretmochelys imbricata]
MAAGSDAPVALPFGVPPPPSRCGSRPRRGCSPSGPRNRAGPPQPPRPPSAAPAGDPYGERVELALREAAPEPSPEAGPGCEELTLDHLLEIVAQLEYHTRPEDGVRVCPHFLLGCCFSGARCPPHRTLLPYLWQLWRSTSLPPGWLSVGPEAHGALERLYGDPGRTHVRASYQTPGFSPRLWEGSGVWWLERGALGARTPGFSPRLWEGSGGWWLELGGRPFAQSIEAALRSGQEEAPCSTADHSYRLDLRAGSQGNLATGTLHPLRARPAFRAPPPAAAGATDALRQPAPGPPAGPGAPPRPPPYPESWAPLAPGQDWRQVPTAVEERGFRLIYGLLPKSRPEARGRLERARRVQNPFLWDKYKRAGRRPRSSGCGSSAISSTARRRAQCRPSANTTWTPGCRGNTPPSTGRAATSPAAPATPTATRPPPRPACATAPSARCWWGARAWGSRPPPLDAGDPASDPYDSCVDSLSDPQIYVVFDGDPCYPYFLLQYRQLDEVVMVG